MSPHALWFWCFGPLLVHAIVQLHTFKYIDNSRMLWHHSTGHQPRQKGFWSGTSLQYFLPSLHVPCIARWQRLITGSAVLLDTYTLLCGAVITLSVHVSTNHAVMYIFRTELHRLLCQAWGYVLKYTYSPHTNAVHTEKQDMNCVMYLVECRQWVWEWRHTAKFAFLSEAGHGSWEAVSPLLHSSPFRTQGCTELCYCVSALSCDGPCNLFLLAITR